MGKVRRFTKLQNRENTLNAFAAALGAGNQLNDDLEICNRAGSDRRILRSTSTHLRAKMERPRAIEQMVREHTLSAFALGAGG